MDRVSDGVSLPVRALSLVDRKTNCLTVPGAGQDELAQMGDCSEGGLGELGATDQQVGKVRIFVVVDEW